MLGGEEVTYKVLGLKITRRKKGLTSRQVSEWFAYDKIDPIGTWREDFRMAQLQSLVVNIVQSLYADPKKAKPKSTTPMDFMINWGEDAEVKTETSLAEQIKQVFSGIASKKEKKVERKLKPPMKHR